mmetsp:Transcript_35382/g.75432  ORF Transcript_35382/g.75432 Transcript_35382/m.75432 type:complete len:241 (+) Transcript_35382:129-851(+)
MFKKPVGFDVVPHRMKGVSAKRDPLLDEKVGSSKRSKASDLSDIAYYKETPEERKARIKREKKVEKALALGLPIPQEEEPQPATSSEPPTKSRKTANAEKMKAFQEKLKSSSLPEEAAVNEKKHKDEIKREEEEALAKLSFGPGRDLAPTKAKTPDEDERLSFNDIWKEGEEEGDADWLSGGGLKFHTTADKAFAMDSKKFKESTASSSTAAGNAEAEAERSRKRAELRMAEFKRSQRGE